MTQIKHHLQRGHTLAGPLTIGFVYDEHVGYFQNPCFDGLYLLQNVDTVALLIDHPRDTANLTLDPAQSLYGGFSVRVHGWILLLS